jgi:4-amino-4-deoxy-L-arabinose transferase-like glycosyltransferase
MPRSLLAWLPLLWRNVLFPGAVSESAHLRWTGVLLVVVLPALLLYPTLGFHLFEPDEGRYAEIPREMLLRGDWVAPHLQGKPYLDKPPLLYWLVMLSYGVFGAHDWSARLVPALALHGSVLVTYFLGRRCLGERTARWGSVLLCLAPGFICMGRLLLLDGLLTFFVALSCFGAFEACRGNRLRWGWWLVSAAACGLGVLTKGPIALVLVVPPLWLNRRLAGAPFGLRWSERLLFVVVVLALTLPWYVAVCLRLPTFARYFLWEHNVVRFLAPFDHPRPIWFYLPVLLAGMLPAVLWLIPFVRFLLAGDPQTAQRRTPELGFVLLTGVWCVFFFSLSGCKLPTYILPAFPFFCLAVGRFLGAHLRTWLPTSVAVLAFVMLLAGQHILVPWYAWYRSPMQQAETVHHYCADPGTHVICYPRDCDTASFYLQRDDLRNFRSKDTEELRAELRAHPRTVVLLTHRHSLRGLHELLPPELHISDEAHIGLADLPGMPDSISKHIKQLAGETALGLCDIAVVEPR